MSTLHHQRWGKGYPVILLHGYCETSDIWSSFASLLSDSFEIIAPDLPGFGNSISIHAPFSIDQIGDHIHDWIASLKLNESPVVIGHSLGGYVALSLAARHDRDVKAFGLFHSTAFADSEEKKANRNKSIEFVSRHGAKPFVDNLIPNLFARKDHEALPLALRIGHTASAEAIMHYAAAMRDRLDRSEVLGRQSARWLIIAGEADSVVPAAISREMEKIAKNAFFELIPGVGHMGMFENLARCAELIRQFVSKQIA